MTEKRPRGRPRKEIPPPPLTQDELDSLFRQFRETVEAISECFFAFNEGCVQPNGILVKCYDVPAVQDRILGRYGILGSDGRIVGEPGKFWASYQLPKEYFDYAGPLSAAAMVENAPKTKVMRQLLGTLSEVGLVSSIADDNDFDYVKPFIRTPRGACKERAHQERDLATQYAMCLHFGIDFSDLEMKQKLLALKDKKLVLPPKLESEVPMWPDGSVEDNRKKFVERVDGILNRTELNSDYVFSQDDDQHINVKFDHSLQYLAYEVRNRQDMPLAEYAEKVFLHRLAEKIKSATSTVHPMHYSYDLSVDCSIPTFPQFLREMEKDNFLPPSVYQEHQSLAKALPHQVLAHKARLLVQEKVKYMGGFGFDDPIGDAVDDLLGEFPERGNTAAPVENWNLGYHIYAAMAELYPDQVGEQAISARRQEELQKLERIRRQKTTQRVHSRML